MGSCNGPVGMSFAAPIASTDFALSKQTQNEKHETLPPVRMLLSMLQEDEGSSADDTKRTAMPPVTAEGTVRPITENLPTKIPHASAPLSCRATGGPNTMPIPGQRT